MNEPNFQNFHEAVKKYRNIVLYIPGSPDPDAMASAFALQQLLKYYSIDSDITSCKKLSLAQNMEFAKLLNIHLKDCARISPEKYDAYAVTDYQSNIIKDITGIIPCAIHIDHHEKADKFEKSDFSIIDQNSGSASTLVALLIKEINPDFDIETMERVATALIFGIQTDTDRYTHTSNRDIEALKFLTPFSIKKIIKRLNVKPLEPETMLCYKNAHSNAVTYKDWGIYPAGYISIKHRDSLAIVADIMLRESGLKTVITFGIVEDKKNEQLILDASFRTNNPKLDLDRLIKGITPGGGARKYKGAFQVKLGYFYGITEREKFLDIVEKATVEKLQKAKDGNYILDIKSVYSGFMKKIASFLKNQ